MKKKILSVEMVDNDKYSLIIFAISAFYLFYSTLQTKSFKNCCTQTESNDLYPIDEDDEQNMIEEESDTLKEIIQQENKEENSDSENASIDSFVCNFVLKNVPIDCSLHKAFQKIHAKDLFYDREVLFFERDVKISTVLENLLKSKCSCCVVTEKNNKIYGIVDTNDIVAFIINNGYDQSEIIASFVRKLIYVYDYTNLLDITQYLKHGIRYIIVKNQITSIISQGSILRYIYSNKALMEQDDVLNTSIINLKICKNQKILTANLDDNIIEAYEKMNSYNITSLPIINLNYECVAILSNSDIKHISFERQSLTCEEYLNFLQKNNTILTFDESDTIDKILCKMITFDVHHLYQLDERECPIGVISYVDIIKALF